MRNGNRFVFQLRAPNFRDVRVRNCLDFRQGSSTASKTLLREFAAVLIEGRRLGQFIIGEPVIGDGFHAMRAGL